MMNLLEQFPKDPAILETLVYRGYNIRFNWNSEGQFVYTTDWPQFDNSEELNFGSNNWDFKDDMKRLIDRRLDTLWKAADASPYKGAKWVQFNNAGFRDLKLLFNKRLLYVYPLTSDCEPPKLSELEKLAFQLLNKFIQC